MHPRTNAIVHAPRSDYVKRPAPIMTEALRRGQFLGFFRGATISRAADFNYAVDLTTGRISYSNRWEDGRLYLQTDHLEEEDEDDRTKVMRRDQSCNLYYVTMWCHEVPSYHFWRRPGDGDPIELARLFTWERDEATETVAEPSSTSGALRECQSDEHVDKNLPPAEESGPPPPAPGLPSSAEETWSITSSELASNPFQPDRRLASTFESQRRKYENRIHRYGLDVVLDEVAEVAPREIARLKRGLTSATTNPSVEREPSNVNSETEILRQSATTAAHKLTQMMMGVRPPPSPLHGNELPVRDGFVPYDNQDWETAPELAEVDRNRRKPDRKGKGKAVEAETEDEGRPEDDEHPDPGGDEQPDNDESSEGDPLAFLDYYNEKSHGNPIIRSEHRSQFSANDIANSTAARKPPQPSDSNATQGQGSAADPIDLGSASMSESESDSDAPTPALCNSIEPDFVPFDPSSDDSSPSTSNHEDEDIFAPLKLTAEGPQQFGDPHHCNRLFYNALEDMERRRKSHLRPATNDDYLTPCQIKYLRERLYLAENELLQREEYCRLCLATFRYGSREVEEHYKQHRRGGSLAGVFSEDFIGSSPATASATDGLFLNVLESVNVPAATSSGRKRKRGLNDPLNTDVDTPVNPSGHDGKPTGKELKTPAQLTAKKAPDGRVSKALQSVSKRVKKAKSSKHPDAAWKDPNAEESGTPSPILTKPKKTKDPKHPDAPFKARETDESEASSPVLRKPRRTKGPKHPDPTYKNQAVDESDAASPLLKKAPKRKGPDHPEAAYHLPKAATEDLSEPDSPAKPRAQPEPKAVGQVEIKRATSTKSKLTRTGAKGSQIGAAKSTKVAKAANKSERTITRRSFGTKIRIARPLPLLESAEAPAEQSVEIGGGSTRSGLDYLKPSLQKSRALVEADKSPVKKRTAASVLEEAAVGEGNLEAEIIKDREQRVRRSREPSPEMCANKVKASGRRGKHT